MSSIEIRWIGRKSKLRNLSIYADIHVHCITSTHMLYHKRDVNDVVFSVMRLFPCDTGFVNFSGNLFTSTKAAASASKGENGRWPSSAGARLPAKLIIAWPHALQPTIYVTLGDDSAEPTSGR